MSLYKTNSLYWKSSLYNFSSLWKGTSLYGSGAAAPPNQSDILSWTLNATLGYDSTDSLDQTDNSIDAKLVESFCAEFNGTTSFFDTEIIQSSSGLFTCYFMLETLGSYRCLGGNGITGSEFFFGVHPSNFVFARMGSSVVAVGATAISVDTIYKFSITWTSSAFTIAVNDVDDAILKNYAYTGTVVNSRNILVGKLLENSSSFYWHDGEIWDVNINTGGTTGQYPLQGSTYDISGNDNHGTPTDITWSTQDYYHYNILNGFDKYLDDATGLIELPVPYVSGSPVVTSVTDYTKQSEHPAGYWHNGAETKLIVGATTFDGTGWNVNADIKTADTEEHLHNAATGYGKALEYDDLVSVFTGDYIFCDVTTANKYKNLIVYGTPPTYADNVAIHRFIGKTDFLTDESTGVYLFDVNGFVLTET